MVVGGGGAMRLRGISFLAVLAVAVVNSGETFPQSPHPNSIAAQLAKPWRHVAGPVSDQKFAQDKAKCAMMGHMAPVGAGTPEIKFLVVFINCMKAEGYAPDDRPNTSSSRRIDDVRGR